MRNEKVGVWLAVIALLVNVPRFVLVFLRVDGIHTMTITIKKQAIRLQNNPKSFPYLKNPVIEQIVNVDGRNGNPQVNKPSHLQQRENSHSSDQQLIVGVGSWGHYGVNQ